MWELSFNIIDHDIDEDNYGIERIYESSSVYGKDIDHAVMSLINYLKDDSNLDLIIDYMVDDDGFRELVITNLVEIKDRSFIDIEDHPLFKNMIGNRKNELIKSK